MKLENIIRNTGASILHGDAGTEIASITSDSRKACPGSLFIAVILNQKFKGRALARAIFFRAIR